MKKRIILGIMIVSGVATMTAFALKSPNNAEDMCCEKKMECTPTPSVTDPAMILENFSRQFVTFSGL